MATGWNGWCCSARARGDFRPESDYDVAVFIRESGTRWDEIMRLARLTAEILIDTGMEISAKPFTAGYYRENHPLMREINRYGVDFLRRRFWRWIEAAFPGITRTKNNWEECEP